MKLPCRLRSDEVGAVAVMVAVLASVLVLVAALSVDLGNAWARGRMVQKQADVSALGAGSLLPVAVGDGPAKQAVAERAAAILNENLAPEQPVTVWGDLLDGTPGNGDLAFLNNAGAACTDVCTMIRLTPPYAYVNFGLAGVVRSGADVTRSASVRVFSALPPAVKVIPLWLPSGCGFGPVDGDTTQGGGPTSPTASTTGPTASPTGPTASATPVAITPRGTHTLSGPAAYSLPYGGSYDVKNLSITNVGSGTKKASVRAVSPDGLSYIEYAAANVKGNPSTFYVSDFTLGQELSLTPGTWKLYAVILQGTKSSYSQNEVSVTVTGGPSGSPSSTTSSPTATATSIPVGCVGQDRGNFGQLDSPRNPTVNNGSRLAVNMAAGLDHLIIPFDSDAHTIEKECAKSNGNNLIPGAQLDSISRPGNNCILGDTGNDGPQWYDGLISGVSTYKGRLEVEADDSNCTGATRVIAAKTINDDKLSCFLRNGATLSTISQETGVDDTMLDASILDSPRFVWLPLVYATDRAQKGYQPIIDYVPAFITDETQTTAATADNGIKINGNSIQTIRLFAINKEALPIAEQSPDVPYDDTLSQPLVRLVG